MHDNEALNLEGLSLFIPTVENHQRRYNETVTGRGSIRIPLPKQILNPTNCPHPQTSKFDVMDTFNPANKSTYSISARKNLARRGALVVWEARLAAPTTHLRGASFFRV